MHSEKENKLLINETSSWTLLSPLFWTFVYKTISLFSPNHLWRVHQRALKTTLA